VTPESQLEAHLYRQIPLTRAMGITVSRVTCDVVELAAPIEPNINHRRTVFGGSASAAATLAAWGILWARLADHPKRPEIIIQSNSMEYLRPIEGAFTAKSLPIDEDDWRRFQAGIDRKGRARIEVESALEFDGETCGRFRGTFVALADGC